ncbi:MAG: alpha/beta hydrolase, partial [Anaerolineales bacterium]|nr:alpha/beta hydrolase [Anaerolineales bacterium]
MRHQEGFFSEQDQSIYYQYWLPEIPPQAILLVVHGLNEHCSRYKHLAKYFTDMGYAVFGFDLIGHGKSSGTRSFVKDFPAFINPILTYLDMIKKWQPGLPIYLVGHSLGGLIGASFLIDHQEKVNGAILSGSLVMVPEYVSDFTIKIGTIISKIIPKIRLIAIDKSGLSRDTQVVTNYINDPLVYNGKSTARILSVINDGISYVAEKGSSITLPILLLHGGQDRICDPSWSTYLHNLISSQNNKLIIYDEL